jgi:hypothetical protein
MVCQACPYICTNMHVCVCMLIACDNSKIQNLLPPAPSLSLLISVSLPPRCLCTAIKKGLKRRGLQQRRRYLMFGPSARTQVLHDMLTRQVEIESHTHTHTHTHTHSHIHSHIPIFYLHIPIYFSYKIHTHTYILLKRHLPIMINLLNALNFWQSTRACMMRRRSCMRRRRRSKQVPTRRRDEITT